MEQLWNHYVALPGDATTVLPSYQDDTCLTPCELNWMYECHCMNFVTCPINGQSAMELFNQFDGHFSYGSDCCVDIDEWAAMLQDTGRWWPQ